ATTSTVPRCAGRWATRPPSRSAPTNAPPTSTPLSRPAPNVSTPPRWPRAPDTPSSPCCSRWCARRPNAPPCWPGCAPWASPAPRAAACSSWSPSRRPSSRRSAAPSRRGPPSGCSPPASTSRPWPSPAPSPPPPAPPCAPTRCRCSSRLWWWSPSPSASPSARHSGRAAGVRCASCERGTRDDPARPGTGRPRGRRPSEGGAFRGRAAVLGSRRPPWPRGPASFRRPFRRPPSSRGSMSPRRPPSSRGPASSRGFASSRRPPMTTHPTLADLARRVSADRNRPAFGHDALITCDRLVRVFTADGVEVQALQGLDLLVREGELMALVGASGSGKSTLMNILAGLDTPTAGAARVAGRDLLTMTAKDRLAYRREVVGFVWQQTARNLLPYLTSAQNVALPMRLRGGRGRAARRASAERALELLDLLEVADCRDRRPHEMSGGQQQRVAIAVALANEPSVLLADEPTGELDSHTAEQIFAAFRTANERLGTTIVIVTHDQAVASEVRRTVAIRDGRTS